MCRSRRELSNEYLLDEIGVDTAENELLQVSFKIIQYYSIVSLEVVQGAILDREMREQLEEFHADPFKIPDSEALIMALSLADRNGRGQKAMSDKLRDVLMTQKRGNVEVYDMSLHLGFGQTPGNPTMRTNDDPVPRRRLQVPTTAEASRVVGKECVSCWICSHWLCATVSIRREGLTSATWAANKSFEIFKF